MGLILKPEPEPEITRRNPAQAPHLFWKPKSQIYRVSQDMRNCGLSQNVVCGYRCSYTVHHTQKSNHLDQNINLNKHKHSLLVNEYCGMQCFST